MRRGPFHLAPTGIMCVILRSDILTYVQGTALYVTKRRPIVTGLCLIDLVATAEPHVIKW